MIEEQQTLEAIRAHVATLPLEVQVKVNRMADALRLVIAIEPQAGEMALALLGAEQAARP